MAIIISLLTQENTGFKGYVAILRCVSGAGSASFEFTQESGSSQHRTFKIFNSKNALTPHTAAVQFTATPLFNFTANPKDPLLLEILIKINYLRF